MPYLANLTLFLVPAPQQVVDLTQLQPHVARQLLQEKRWNYEDLAELYFEVCAQPQPASIQMHLWSGYARSVGDEGLVLTDNLRELMQDPETLMAKAGAAMKGEAVDSHVGASQSEAPSPAPLHALSGRTQSDLACPSRQHLYQLIGADVSPS
jgi:hypothetical protein